MNILKYFDNFINEAVNKPFSVIVDSDKEVKSLKDVPSEVFETAKKILNDIFDRVHKPVFEYNKNKGLTITFFVGETDFKYIDEDEILTLDKGIRKKRMYDVSLEYIDRITETFEVKYKIRFEMLEDTEEEEDDYLDDEDDDVIVDDDYEKPNPEDLEFFDDDQADADIKKGKIKIQDFDDFEDRE